MMKFIKFFCLIGYYVFAQHLPASDNRYVVWVRPIRRIFCSCLFKYMGEKVNIEKGAKFGIGDNVEIGSYSGLGKNCLINGPVRIGNYVMIGPDVMLLARSHRFDSIEIPMALQGEVEPRIVEIGDDVWIGARAIILPGVTIGRGAVVGAGAVVTKKVPSFAVVGGNPAKIIKWRKLQQREDENAK